MRYKCIVIDDENYAAEMLEEHIEQIPQLELVKTYNSPVEALNEITKGENVDIIFLDIEMPYLNGIQLGNILREKTNFLVLTTAHLKYVVESYEINASKYLLKPITFTAFESVVNELIYDKKSTPTASHSSEVQIKRHFLIKPVSKRRLANIMTEDIIFIEINKDELSIHTTRETYVTNLTLKEAELQLLGTGEFTKPNRSFIIASKYIAFIDNDKVEMISGKIISIGEIYRERLRKDLNKNMFRARS